MVFFLFCEEHIADDNGWTYFSVCIQRSIICTSLWMKATFRHSEMLQLMLLIYWMKNILDMEHLFTWLHSKWWYIETCACTFLIYKPRQFMVLQHTGHWLAVGSKYMYWVLIMMLPLCWHTIEIIHPFICLTLSNINCPEKIFSPCLFWFILHYQSTFGWRVFVVTLTKFLGQRFKL